MNKLKCFILVLALVIGGSLFAQSQRELQQLMRERNEYYFTLTVQEPSEIQGISKLCSVDGTDGRTVVCYANQQQYDNLLLAGYQPELQTPPSMLDDAVMWDGSNRAAYEWDSYPTYDAYQSMMEAFPSQALSDRSCTLRDLGTLNSGRKLLGVRLNNGQPDGKPRFLYSSTMHGDEVTGMMLMLRLIDEFCTSTDPRIVNILNNVDLFIFPLTNPDGTYYGGNSTMNRARRYNIDGVDLNRNYKDYFNGDHPDGNTYALETQWTMQLAQDYLFTMSANYHGGAEVVNYPWDAVYTDHADKDWYQLISAEYVSNARTYSSSYMTYPYSSGVTNGADWYVITGSRQDYENAYGECREITVECSTTKKPNASTMPTYWNYNHTAMLALIEQCLNGIHGYVYDAETNQPIVGATITVQNHDANNSEVSTHTIGDFHRPIKGGTYTLVISKNDYCPQTVEVTVADNQRVDLDTIFLTSGCPTPDIINMQDGSFETCDALFYDSGGPDSNYGNSLDYTLTFYPATTGAKVIVDFSEFNTESNYDYLYIYDGTSTSATQIGQYSGTTSPGTVTATNDEGALTFRFTSDYSVNKSGWVATVSCEMPSSVQTFELVSGWNWWSTNVDITLSELKEALGTHGLRIAAQDGKFATYNANSGTWSGNLQSIELGKMYKIRTSEACTITLNGEMINPSDYPISLYSGNNWIGFLGNESLNLNEAFGDFTPTDRDIIKSANGKATYYQGYGWQGSLNTLEPGKGYIYKSNATTVRTFTYPSSTNK
jgi:hypothetical protein